MRKGLALGSLVYRTHKTQCFNLNLVQSQCPPPQVFTKITGSLGKCLLLLYQFLRDAAVRAQAHIVISRLKGNAKYHTHACTHSRTWQRISDNELAWNILRDFAIFQGEWKDM